MKMHFLYLLSLFIVLLPSKIKIPIYRVVFKYKIGKGVRIGFSWIYVEKLEIGDYVNIYHLNRFKNVLEVNIGSYTNIGFGNTFTSTFEFTNAKSLKERGNKPFLKIGEHCGITMFHYFDIQDKVIVGSYTTIAGRGSVFFTHYLNILNGEQSAKDIFIGDYCMVGSNVRFAPGASVPSCCIIGMGSVITKKFEETHCLIVGEGATVVKKFPLDAAYFNRKEGWIGSYTKRR